MKIRYTATWTEEVHDLDHYEAKTLEEAAENLDGWLRDGSASIEEAIAHATDLSFAVRPE